WQTGPGLVLLWRHAVLADRQDLVAEVDRRGRCVQRGRVRQRPDDQLVRRPRAARASHWLLALVGRVRAQEVLGSEVVAVELGAGRLSRPEREARLRGA